MNFLDSKAVQAITTGPPRRFVPVLLSMAEFQKRGHLEWPIGYVESDTAESPIIARIDAEDQDTERPADASE